MDRVVLSVNPGSSSHKYAIYQGETELAEAHYESTPDGFELTYRGQGEPKTTAIDQTVFQQALADFLGRAGADRIDAVGLRVVAPGRYFLDHHLLDERTEAELRAAEELAELHIKPLLKELSEVRRLLPDAPLAAISDSAFHKSLTHEARNYAIGRADADKYDVYRFGYHGLSVGSIVERLAAEDSGLPAKLIVCHLGSGASITAVKDGLSVDTSMGFSPLEGLVMATRSGNLDVTAALRLKRLKGLDDQQLEDYLNHQSGLKGLGGDGDIRALLRREADGEEAAGLALNVMAYRLRTYIGAYLAVLGGLDTLVFTATVGVRSAPVRRRVLSGLEHLGIALDEALNEQGAERISRADGAVAVRVIPADENRAIAQATRQLVESV